MSDNIFQQKRDFVSSETLLVDTLHSANSLISYTSNWSRRVISSYTASKEVLVALEKW